MKFRIMTKWLVSILLLCYSTLSLAEIGDIRYRTIIYLYPEETRTDFDMSGLSLGLDNFTVVDELPDEADKAYIVFNSVSNFSDTYPVPTPSYLAYFGRGLTEKQVELIQSSNNALIIDVAYPHNSAHKNNKKINAWVLDVAGKHDAAIWDSETRELFSTEAWQVKRIDSWEEWLPIMKENIVIHSYEDNGSVRAITLGMAKFGLPDIVVNNFSWSHSAKIGELINLVAQTLIEGANVTELKTLNLDIHALNETGYKKSLLEIIELNANAEVAIGIGDAEWEEGDPYNYLMELMFDNVEGSTLSEKQEQLLTQVFGRHDPLLQVTHNEKILDASNRAKAKLNQLKKHFESGLEPGEFIQVKAPFLTTDGENEWMWVEITSWSNQTIEGLLRNQPYNVPDLKRGSKVLVNQSDVFDYYHTFPDGSSEGDETGELIMKFRN